MEGSIINRDLVLRWSKRHWFWAIFIVFALQMAGLFAFRQPLHFRPVEREPVLELPAGTASKSSGDWLALEDPMLFAAPGWHGVSAAAWMRKPESRFRLVQPFPAVHYLAYADGAGLVTPISPGDFPWIAGNGRPVPAPIVPVHPPAPPEPRSTLVAEGFDFRSVVILPELPVQYHSDALGATVLQGAIDIDGIVVSTRILNSSGSRRADADALAIARRLRFEPVRTISAGAPEISWGTLIFRWHALDLTSTNAVRR